MVAAPAAGPSASVSLRDWPWGAFGGLSSMGCHWKATSSSHDTLYPRIWRVASQAPAFSAWFVSRFQNLLGCTCVLETHTLSSPSPQPHLFCLNPRSWLYNRPLNRLRQQQDCLQSTHRRLRRHSLVLPRLAVTVATRKTSPWPLLVRHARGLESRIRV